MVRELPDNCTTTATMIRETGRYLMHHLDREKMRTPGGGRSAMQHEIHIKITQLSYVDFIVFQYNMLKS